MGNVDELIQVQVLAARVACEQITSPALKRLHGGTGGERDNYQLTQAAAGAHGCGDAEDAAREMESHLRVLHYMGRLARRPSVTAKANRTWVRDTLWRKDRQFAALLDHILSTEVAGVRSPPCRRPAERPTRPVNPRLVVPGRLLK